MSMRDGSVGDRGAVEWVCHIPGKGNNTCKGGEV